MNANTGRATSKSTTLSFRHRKSRRQMLEAIQAEKGHGDLSDTLREAVDDYIEAHIRKGPSQEVRDAGELGHRGNMGGSASASLPASTHENGAGS